MGCAVPKPPGPETVLRQIILSTAEARIFLVTRVGGADRCAAPELCTSRTATPIADRSALVSACSYPPDRGREALEIDEGVGLAPAFMVRAPAGRTIRS